MQIGCAVDSPVLFTIAQEGVRFRDRAVPSWSLVVTAALAAIAVIAGQNLLLWWFFPHLQRVTTDFSPMYLRREIVMMPAHGSDSVVFLGDSVLWGYAIEPGQSAVSLLISRGCACENLSFKASSPPNYYVLARLMQRLGVHPKAVFIEINQKVLNQADNAYAALYPAVGDLARAFDVLTPAEQQELNVKPARSNVRSRIDRILAKTMLMYAMRSDIRETWYGDPAPALPRLTQDLLMGTYDLTPLDTTNVGVSYLNKAFDVFRDMGVPVIAFTTPTNHRLMHQYIDGPDYAANDEFLVQDAKRHGARVLDLDKAMPAGVFIDESHLTPPGQQRLAKIFTSAISGLNH